VEAGEENDKCWNRSTNAAGNEANMIAGRQNQAHTEDANSGLLRQNVTNSRKILNQGLA